MFSSLTPIDYHHFNYQSSLGLRWRTMKVWALFTWRCQMLIPCFGNTDFKIVVKFNDTYLTDHVLSLSGAGFKALDKNFRESWSLWYGRTEDDIMTSDSDVFKTSLHPSTRKFKGGRCFTWMNTTRPFTVLLLIRLPNASFCSRRCGRTSRQNARHWRERSQGNSLKGCVHSSFFHPVFCKTNPQVNQTWNPARKTKQQEVPSQHVTPFVRTFSSFRTTTWGVFWMLLPCRLCFLFLHPIQSMGSWDERYISLHLRWFFWFFVGRYTSPMAGRVIRQFQKHCMQNPSLEFICDVLPFTNAASQPRSQQNLKLKGKT